MSAEQAGTLKSLEDAVRRAGRPSADSTRFTFDCAGPVFTPAGRVLHDAGARLLTLSALRAVGEELLLTYTFEVGPRGIVTVRTLTHERGVESLFTLFPAADFLEREVNNLFGVKFLGHPNLSHTTVHREEEELGA